MVAAAPLTKAKTKVVKMKSFRMAIPQLFTGPLMPMMVLSSSDAPDHCQKFSSG
jgi:hypothetical protein